MSTKIKLKEVEVGDSFPAVWEGTFTEPPQSDDVEDKKSIIQKLMNDDKEEKVSNGASPKFKLVFDWDRKSEDPVTYTLTVKLALDERFGKSEGSEVAPTPLKPPPPPK